MYFYIFVLSCPQIKKRHGAIFTVGSNTFIRFWLRKTSMSVETYQLSFHMLFGFSFLFLFLCYPYFGTSLLHLIFYNALLLRCTFCKRKDIPHFLLLKEACMRPSDLRKCRLKNINSLTCCHDLFWICLAEAFSFMTSLTVAHSKPLLLFCVIYFVRGKK